MNDEKKTPRPEQDRIERIRRLVDQAYVNAAKKKPKTKRPRR